MNRLTIILTIIFAVAGSAMATAVDYPTYKPTTPQYTTPVYSVAEGSLNDQQQSFNSTSSYSKQLDESASRRTVNPFDASGMQVNRSYTVPVAASSVTGGVTTLDAPTNAPTGRRRVIGTGDEDLNPGEQGQIDLPIGDTPWFFMLILGLAFTAFRSFRKERILSNNQ